MPGELPDRQQTDARAKDPQTFARLFRHADTLSVSDATKRLLLANYFEDSHLRSRPLESPDQRLESNRASAVENVRILKGKLHKLVQEEGSWEEMSGVAWKLLALQPSPSLAAKIVELAYLHGTLKAVQATFERLAGFGRSYYPLIHPTVRVHIVVRLWQNRCAEQLATLLFYERDADYLQPIERLLIFCSILKSKDPTAPYMYYKRHKQALFTVVAELGEHLRLTPPRLRIYVGRLALGLGHLEEGREVLGEIPPDAPEYDEGLKLLLDVKVDAGKPGHVRYADLLLAAGTDDQRLRRFREFFCATRKLGGVKDLHRPELNDILADPLQWFSRDPQQWEKATELIWESRDLLDLLPNLYAVFQEHAVQFHGPQLDLSLWRCFLARGRPHNPRDLYWYGVALLHQYVCGGPEHELALWEGRRCVIAAKKDWARPRPFSWAELHKAAYAHLQKDRFVMERERGQMLLQMQVASEADQVTVPALTEYLDYTKKPIVEVLNSLQHLAKNKQAPKLETKIILKRAAATHLTNRDLNRLWRMSTANRKHDLSWRIATLIMARGVLVPQVQHAWEISGEKRSYYPFAELKGDCIECCFHGFTSAEKKLAHACLTVGPLLPELLAILDVNAKAIKLQSFPVDSVEGKIDRLLLKMPWFKGVKKRYRFGDEGLVGRNLHLPPFMQVLPSNSWSLLVARLTDALGLNAWRFKVSYLHDQIVDLVPKLANRQDLKRYSGRVAKWLRHLTPEQRTAWQELVASARKFTDQDAADVLATFVCRLATLIHQSHYTALTSLQAMRAPLPILWSLENWLLSVGYSRVRSEIGTANRVIVPNACSRLESLTKQ